MRIRRLLDPQHFSDWTKRTSRCWLGSHFANYNSLKLRRWYNWYTLSISIKKCRLTTFPVFETFGDGHFSGVFHDGWFSTTGEPCFFSGTQRASVENRSCSRQTVNLCGYCSTCGPTKHQVTFEAEEARSGAASLKTWIVIFSEEWKVRSTGAFCFFLVVYRQPLFIEVHV